MSFLDFSVPKGIAEIQNLINTTTLRHEATGVVVELSLNKIVNLEFDEICTAEHVKNVINEAFLRLQMEIVNKYQA